MVYIIIIGLLLSILYIVGISLPNRLKKLEEDIKENRVKLSQIINYIKIQEQKSTNHR